VNCPNCSKDDSIFYMFLEGDVNGNFICREFQIKIEEYEILHVKLGSLKSLVIYQNGQKAFRSDYINEYVIYVDLDIDSIKELNLEDNLIDYYKNIIKKEITLKQFL
jgi:hypothetical protein